VPEDSIATYWRDHPAEFTEPGKARVRHVLIGFRPSDGPDAREAARLKATDARRRIAGGEDFGAVAREISDDTGSAGKGGELGELTRGSVVKEFGDVAFTIPVNDLSEVFETKYGFHVLQVESRKPDHLRPLSDCVEEIHGVIGRDIADSLARGAALEFLAAVAKSNRFPTAQPRAGPAGPGACP
jgi:peptidyl-prolyl cis-trans isomerase D